MSSTAKAPRNQAARETVLIKGGTVVRCDGSGRVERASVLLQDGRIQRVAKGLRAPSGARVVDAQDRLVLPGLIMTHVHLCQAIMRGAADDLHLLDWLRSRIWPLEAAHNERSLRASAELGLTEMLLAGVTTIVDLGTVHDHDVVFDACVRSGIRVYGGKSLMDRGEGVPPRLAEPTLAGLVDAERLEREWNKHPSGRVEYAWIPRFILSCSEELIRGAVERANASGGLMHTHASEHAGERAAVRAMLGASDIALLRRWGFRGPRASIAHGVQLTAGEMKTLAKDGTSVVHCPSANLKLGSGIAQLAKLLDTGVRVGIGADGAPCNNNLDPWVELRRAALLSSVRAEPGAVPATRALDLLTRNGAELVGAGAELGSIEVGKRADLIVVRRDGPHVAPASDPVGTLVYATQSRDVEHVFVDGKAVVSDGQLLTLDSARVVAEARREAARLTRRAGL